MTENKEQSFRAVLKELFPDKIQNKGYHFCLFHNDRNTPNLEIKHYKDKKAFCWACNNFFQLMIF
jgi:hypothetical protein